MDLCILFVWTRHMDFLVGQEGEKQTNSITHVTLALGISTTYVTFDMFMGRSVK